MNIEMLRIKARRLVEKLEWQLVADSPTTKYYTRWDSFEKLLTATPRIDYSSNGEGLELCGNGGQPLGLLPVDESRLAAAHYANLKLIDTIEARNEVVEAKLCTPRGQGWASQHVVARLHSSKLLLHIRRGAGGSVALEVDAKGRSSLLVASESSSPLALILRVHVEGDLTLGILSRNSSDVRLDAKIVLGRDGSSLTARALTVSVAGASDTILSVIHDRRSASTIDAYGMALNNSMVSVRGIAKVTAGARGSKTRVWVEALAVGDEAKAYASPFLEVDTGDVEEASHSAASYRIGVEKLFYLESRGLSLEDSVKLLVVERAKSIVRLVGVEEDKALGLNLP